MADTQTLARAIIEIGGEGVKDAENEIKAFETKLETLGTSYRSGKLRILEYAAESRRLRKTISELQAGIAGAEAAVKKYGSAQAASVALTTQAEASSRSYGQGVMSASFVLHEFGSANGDLARPLDRLQNHLPTLLGQLGMGSGMAGVVSRVSRDVGLLLPEVVAIAREFGFFEDAAQGAAMRMGELNARILELEARPLKLAADLEELDEARRKFRELEAARRSFEHLRRNQSAGEQGSGTAVARVIRETAGGEDIPSRLEEKEVGRTIGPVGMVRQNDTAARDRPGMLADEARERESRLLADVTGAGGEAVREPRPIGKDAVTALVEARKQIAEQLEAIGEHDLASNVRESRPASLEPLPTAQERGGHELLGRTPHGTYEPTQRERVERKAEAESSRFARALGPDLSREILKPGGTSDSDLRSKVKDALQKAGFAAGEIGLVLEATVRKLREEVDRRMTERRLGGLSESQATRAVFETDRQSQGGTRPETNRAGVPSDQEFSRNLMVPSSPASYDPTFREQLAEQKKAVGELKGIARILSKTKGPGFARVAPRGAR